jgi:hypothetical protein
LHFLLPTLFSERGESQFRETTLTYFFGRCSEQQATLPLLSQLSLSLNEGESRASGRRSCQIAEITKGNSAKRFFAQLSQSFYNNRPLTTNVFIAGQNFGYSIESMQLPSRVVIAST